jgi:hypothetical protein
MTTKKVWTRVAVALGALLGGCTTTSRVQVNSTPEGARILIDGADSGQVTPSSVQLSNDKENYTLTVEKPGFNPVVRDVKFSRDVDVMGPEEAGCRICIAPCCLGFSLLKFLHPFDVTSKFVPSQIDATLEVAGQGARLSVSPEPFEVYLDGKLVALLERNYLVTAPGDHELEIRATGCRSYRRSIHVDERVYQKLDVELAVEGQGLLLRGAPTGAKIYVDDQFQGNLGEGNRRVKAESGPHQLRIEADGYRTWTDVVQVQTDHYEELVIQLRLEGQGFVVRKPEGLPATTPEIQVQVDGTLRASAFDAPVRVEPGAHDVEIRVNGRQPRHLRVEVPKDGWIDLEPGPARDGNTQVVVDVQGVRVNAPPDLETTPPQDVQILVSGSLRGQLFGRLIPLEPGDYDVELRIRGYRPWSQRVHVSSKQALDVWPQPVKE